jgi:hypothetical protein
VLVCLWGRGRGKKKLFLRGKGWALATSIFSSFIHFLTLLFLLLLLLLLLLLPFSPSPSPTKQLLCSARGFISSVFPAFCVGGWEEEEEEKEEKKEEKGMEGEHHWKEEGVGGRKGGGSYGSSIRGV